jgi:hypothetical protein
MIINYKTMGPKGEGLKKFLSKYAQIIVNSDYFAYFNFFITHADQDLKIESLKTMMKNILDELNPQERDNKNLV